MFAAEVLSFCFCSRLRPPKPNLEFFASLFFDIGVLAAGKLSQSLEYS